MDGWGVGDRYKGLGSVDGWGAAERSSLDQACMEITRPISDWKQAHKTVIRQTSSPL